LSRSNRNYPYGGSLFLKMPPFNGRKITSFAV
jgi:hypothetical protein